MINLYNLHSWLIKRYIADALLRIVIYDDKNGIFRVFFIQLQIEAEFS